MKTEFEEFLSSAPTPVAASTRQTVLRSVSADLAPSALRVWSKLALVHLFAGGATLLVCPQFGVGPLGGGHGLMHYFMPAGRLACAALCGAWFMGSTGVAALVFLTREELSALRARGARPFGALAALSVALLMGLGGRGLAWDATAVWALSAVAAAYGITRLQLRKSPETV